MRCLIHRKQSDFHSNQEIKIEKLMKPIKVAIVEDNREIREGLALLINGSPNFQCVLACASAEAALVEIPRHQPDVVLMDIGLPGISGIECIRRLKELVPKTQM